MARKLTVVLTIAIAVAVLWTMTRQVAAPPEVATSPVASTLGTPARNTSADRDPSPPPTFQSESNASDNPSPPAKQPTTDRPSDRVTFFGRVQTEDGTVVPGTTVSIRDPSDRSVYAEDNALTEVASDRAGLFEATLPLKRYEFSVAGFDDWESGSAYSGDPDNEVIIVLRHVGELITAFGKVSREDGTAYAGVEVRKNLAANSVLTQNDGSYRLEYRARLDRPYALDFVDPSKRNEHGAPLVRTGVLVMPEQHVDNTVRVDVTMKRDQRPEFAELAIQVVDTKGEGVKSTVTVVEEFGASMGPTNDGGWWETRVIAERSYEVRIDASADPDPTVRRAFERAVVEDLFVPGDGLSITVTLKETGLGTLEVTLLRPDRSPLTSLPVVVHSLRASSGDREPMPLAPDPQGLIVVNDLPQGPALVYQPAGRHFAWGIDVVANEVTSVIAYIDDGHASIIGRLIDADGKPIASHPVVLAWGYPDGQMLNMDNQTGEFKPPRLPPPPGHAASVSLRETTTDGDGAFGFYGLAPEPHFVVALADKESGYHGHLDHEHAQLAAQWVTPGADEVTLVAPR